MGLRDSGTWGRGDAGTRGLGNSGLGNSGTWDVGTRGRGTPRRRNSKTRLDARGLEDVINKQHLTFALNLKIHFLAVKCKVIQYAREFVIRPVFGLAYFTVRVLGT